MPERLASRLLCGHRTVLALLLLATAVHALALLAIHHRRGNFAAYAFQSPDAGEYVALARGLAWNHAYVQLDSAGRPLSGPDTWRTPGYPLFLASVIRLAGDAPTRLLLAQQLIAIASVPLLWLAVRPLTSPRWAFLAALAWCFDPFRVYYSLWLLSETLFTFVLLLACRLWTQRAAGFSPRGPTTSPSPLLCACLGALAGALVLIRPIAAPLPLLALIGVALAARRAGHRRLAVATLGCLLGIAAILGPWLERNRRLTGHLALSQQSGASFAYHKVLDVILWSQGRSDYRFDPATQAALRDQIDLLLRQKWSERFGPLTDAQRQSLRWQNLNYGKPLTDVDPFIASSLLWSVGLDLLAERPLALAACFTVQGLGMLVFPLNLVIAPPASAGSSPLSTLLGTGLLSTLVSIAIGLAYAALAGLALARVFHAAVRRRPSPALFVFWPALAMFVLSLPFEDPRFRLPLIPLFLILAVPARRTDNETRSNG